MKAMLMLVVLSGYGHMWGSHAPKFARDLGHVAATHARRCDRWEMIPFDPLGRMRKLPGCGEFAASDSALVVASLDSLFHLPKQP